MSDWDDLEDVTPRISNDDAERLLSGTSRVDEPRDLADISAIVAALRGPADPSELTSLQSALVAFRAAVVASEFDPSTARTRSMFKKRLTGKTLAAIGVVTLVSAGAAAAGGLVPTPFSAPRPSITKTTEGDDDDQGDEIVVADALDSTTTSTEVDADDQDEAAETETDAATAGADAPDSTDQGPDVNGPAKFGLCTAFAARTKHDEETTTTAAATPPAEPVAETSDLPLPFQKLTDAATTAGQSVADFCADAVPGGTEHANAKAGDNPSATAPGQSEDDPSATEHGKSGDNPSVTAPGKSGEHGGSHGKP